jgi:hypothetical protein
MYGRPLDIRVLTKEHENETYKEWIKRFDQIQHSSPRPEDILNSPFSKFVMPACKTQEKFRWCVANIGLYNFHEIMYDRNFKTTKIWLFDDDSDAVMFKLRWVNEKEDESYIFDPKSNSFNL